jgi:hypothetical protein
MQQVTSNAELLALPNGSVVAQSNGTIHRLITTGLVHEPHVLSILPSGLTVRENISELDESVQFAEPMNVILLG